MQGLKDIQAIDPIVDGLERAARSLAYDVRIFHLGANPDRTFEARIADIGKELDKLMTFVAERPHFQNIKTNLY